MSNEKLRLKNQAEEIVRLTDALALAEEEAAKRGEEALLLSAKEWLEQLIKELEYNRNG